MKVPFINLKPENSFLRGKLLNAAKRIFSSGDFILGRQVCCFEKEFADYCRAKYAVGVNSGTDALFLALLSLGVGTGDEVICPVYTYIATALSISYTGAAPVFVDVDKSTFNIDPDKIEKSITEKTKAILVVHLYGRPADMTAILKIAKAHHLKIIEDAAQAHGALWMSEKKEWKVTGSIGDIGCFSFYPTKNLSGCGDGGMVITNNLTIYRKICILRDQGRKGKKRYLHVVKGYNCRLDSIQAAILREKLKYLNKHNQMRQSRAKLYSKLLADCSNIVIPAESSFVKHVFHIYPVLVKNRNRICKHLNKRKIQANVVYPIPIHLQGAYKELGYKKGDFPAAEQIAKEILCLPIYPYLEEKKIKFVVKNLKELI